MVRMRRPPTITWRRFGAARLPVKGLFRRLQPVKTTPAVATASLINFLRLVMALNSVAAEGAAGNLARFTLLRTRLRDRVRRHGRKPGSPDRA